MSETGPDKSWFLTGTLLLLTFSLPFFFLSMAKGIKPAGPPIEVGNLATVFEPTEIIFEAIHETHPRDIRPRVTNVNVVDLDEDGRNEVLVCDAVRNTVFRQQLSEDGTWVSERLVPENTIPVPAHTTVVDIDGDSDNDILVAVLRNVWPSNKRTGQVVLLENDGADSFSARVLAKDLRRVTDVQAGDFDADGDMDFVAAVFGYLHGRIVWFEQVEPGVFADHELLNVPGTIHVPVVDFDQDGDLDIAAVVSQDEEEVWIFENTGSEKFDPKPRRIWSTSNFDLGLAGMVAKDLDQDGDVDLMLSAGDNLELSFPCPQPYHGCIWLENKGRLKFKSKRIATLGGTYASDVADLDNDGDNDVVLASLFNDWKQTGATSLAWLENDGSQNFKAWHIAESPTHLCAVATGDLNGDGVADIVGGSLQAYPPYEAPPIGVGVWLNRAKESAN